MNPELTYRSIVFAMTAIERERVLDRLPESFRLKAYDLIQREFKGYTMGLENDEVVDSEITELKEKVETLQQAVIENQEEILRLAEENKRIMAKIK